MRRITLPTLDAAVARKVLVGFVRDEIRKVGLNKAVLGLSGGIDSALSCFIAAEALGPENVLAVRMPYRTSSPRSPAPRTPGGARARAWRHCVPETSWPAAR